MQRDWLVVATLGGDAESHVYFPQDFRNCDLRWCSTASFPRGDKSEGKAGASTGKEDKKEEAAPATDKKSLEADDTEEVVFVLQKDNRVKKVKVKTDIQDLNFIEIIDGIKAGDQVITGPYNTVSKLIKDSSLVKVVSKDKLFEDKKKD